MKIGIEASRQTVCNHCKTVIGSYYPETKGAVSISLKNDDGEHESHDYCNEGCLRGSLNSRHSIRNQSIPAVAQEVCFGRNGMVTLDFTKAIQNKKV